MYSHNDFQQILTQVTWIGGVGMVVGNVYGH